MRRRVTIGFLSIVCLLFFSGMVSFVELSHLSRDTGEILKANKRNIELAKEMLDAAYEQNVALIRLSVFGDNSYDSLCRSSMERLENTLLVAQSEALDKSFLDSLAFATTELRLLTDNYLAFGAHAAANPAAPDSVGRSWYDSEYEVLYGRLTAAIKNYMTSTQSSLAPRAEQMKKNAYRAVTPVLISLVVMIAIVLMLYYFMSDEQGAGRLPLVPRAVRRQGRLQGRGLGAEGEDRDPDNRFQAAKILIAMRVDVVLRYVGVVMLFIALFMLLSAGISFVSGMDSAFYPLLLASLLTALLGAFPLIFVERTQQITNKEGFCIVVGSWLVACLVGMFPYLIWGGEFSLVNAWFESVSGFTTTGSTILNDIEVLPRGLQFWRMSSTWIGGMGVVMFALLILPSLGRNKMTLSSVELSTLAKDNYRYRTQIIVQILLVVYVGLTVLTTVLLKMAGMNWFDSLCHAMSACATSGFSTKNASVAYFNSPMIDTILIFAMATAGIHFGLIYATVTGKRNNIFRSEVTRWYLVMLLGGGLLIAVSLFAANIYPTFSAAFHHALFQFVSLVTTTGFATADSNQWTSFAVILLIFGSIVCACAGSTAGGIKTNRLVLAMKMMRTRLRQQQHPNAIIRIKLDGVIQENEALHSVMIFIVAYLMLILAGTVLGTMFGVDLMTSFSGSVASIGNVGPGFGQVGSMDNFSSVPGVFKISSSLLMLLGRLEIFGLIQLFFIKWWR